MLRAGAYKTESRAGALASPNDAIFPIVSQEEDGTFVAIGTGFFIGADGLFVTAAHVVREVLDSEGRPKGPFGLFQLASENHYMLRSIVVVTRHVVADVAVGIAAPMHHVETKEPLRNKTLVLTRRSPGIGSIACTYAFPLTEVTTGKPQAVRFTPGFFEGVVRKHYANGRDSVMLPGPCFETSIVMHGAASGGPVFDQAGNVFAINSTGYGDSPLSFVACVTPLFELSLERLRLPGDISPRTVSVLELAERGFVTVAEA